MSATASQVAPVRVFVSYRHADNRILGELRDNLGWLRHSERVILFDDTQILAGEDWDARIKKELEFADIIILVVSAKFMGSHYCTNVELKEALQYRAQRGTRIIPIIAQHCDWEAMQIRSIAALPKDAANNLKPLNKWSRDRDEALTQIAQQIRMNVDKIQQQKQERSRLVSAMLSLKSCLDTTRTASQAQAQRRNDLHGAMTERLKPAERLEYEKFFFRYFDAMSPSERFEFEMIRAITEGLLHHANTKIAALLATNPSLLMEIPNLRALQQHLEFWLNKFERVFLRQPGMCVLYVGVEDGVPFPRDLDREVETWLGQADAVMSPQGGKGE
jgi:hypothetical protein